MNARKRQKPASTPAHVDCYHPLRLQQLTPEQFTITVNKILSGKLKLLIQRLE